MEPTYIASCRFSFLAVLTNKGLWEDLSSYVGDGSLSYSIYMLTTLDEVITGVNLAYAFLQSPKFAFRFSGVFVWTLCDF